jgi:hypothetical protein
MLWVLPIWAVMVILSYLSLKLFGVSMGKAQASSIPTSLTNIVLLVPLIETFLFYFLPYNMLVFNKPNHRKVVYVGVSALAFAVVHLYNFLFFVSAFIIGIFLAARFYHVAQKEKEIIATLSIFITHAMFNFTTYIVKKYGCFFDI